MSRAPFLLACLIGLALTASPAAANRAQETMVQDDGLLLYSSAEQRDATLDELHALGADSVRAFVYWSTVAPAADSTQRPPDFDGADPADYPSDLWNRFDGLVRAAQARGLSVVLTPTSPAPAWASECAGSVTSRQSCRPDPAEFGAFLRALGTRYSGAYADEDEGGGTLPRVARWGLWNEPNVGRWLTPQFVRRGRRLVPASPARYRRLAAAAIDGLHATGHAGDEILLGETAPIGHTTGPISRRPMATARFWRNLLCLDRSGRALRGRAAVEQGCTRPRRLLASAIAHHPYVRGGSRAPHTRPRPDEVTIANPGRLQAILDQGARRGRLSARLPVYYTEFGFQTNPPDRVLGVSLRRQAEYLNQSDWMAFRQSRVRGIAQYLLRDDLGNGGFQSGLKFSDGRIKPAYGAYRFPIWVVRRGVSVTVFGQVRHARDGASGVVRVQVRLPGKDWSTYRTVKPNRKGFVLTRLWSKRGSWRLVWEPDGGQPDISRVAREATR
ncbi:MAG TPA: hypothetical protein VNB64_05815 [Solirubrobacteraceae bacterium]|nr:hypothetical protein [Solirubrobacteraceae bacterium]